MMKYDDNVESRYGIILVNDRVVRKEAQVSTRANFEWIRKLVTHIMLNPNPMVVPIYRFETIEEELPSARNGNWGTFKYAYEMMRLPMLDKAEKNLISKLISRYKPVTRDDPDPAIQAGWKDYPVLVQFMNQVLADRYYTDLHNNNFLKDEEGNYRIIDLEGFSRYPSVGTEP
jgi:hypothetical protein